MADMSHRTTVVLSDAELRALRAKSRATGVSQSELIREAIRRLTTSPGARPRPTVGWLRLTAAEQAAIDRDDMGDLDA
jgi:hypothetical protein